jgi:predicted helicase
LLSDDYAKFIRYCHSRIEQTGHGTIGMITKNSYLNVTAFKGMRIKLLEFFDKIYILNLHGKMYEKCSDGTPNENVFDIRVGTAIMFLVKNNTKQKNELGRLFVKELNGSRDFKYEYLSENNLTSVDWEELVIDKRYYFFENKNFENSESYNSGLCIENLYKINNSGVETGRDHFILADKKNELERRLNDFIDEEIPIDEIRLKYDLKDQPKFQLESVKKLFNSIDSSKFEPYSHKPFYNRCVYYDKLLLRRHSEKVMSHFLNDKDNVSLILKKRYTDKEYHHCFCTNSITDRNYLSGQTYVFPLYLYSENNEQQTIEDKSERTPNLNQEMVAGIAKTLNLSFTNEKETTENTFAPIDILDYIYAVLHSPTYREKYKEFLQIDFPRVPYPKDKETFWQLVKLGGEIRQIHLLESPIVEKYITQYPEDGDNVVGKPKYQDGKVYINDTQYFDNVPQIVWEFYIGGYQPAQKWLKDRKERTLEFDDILHYQKIVVALSETDRLMKEINKIKIE